MPDGQGSADRGEPDVYGCFVRYYCHGFLRVLPSCDPLAPSAPREPRLSVTRGGLWRDVRLAPFVLREALNVALEDNRSRAVTTLPASGALPTFRRHIPLVEMIRAWATFPGRDRFALTIHMVDQVAAYDLTSGRIDVPRLFFTEPSNGLK
ncbi:hypothetical protein [Arthrobacter sp. Soil736]|uniref:hypothetical protein n=1 Tax=Arthrobacter sp. Soil736 TaxID=1736395 RepID=UPI0012F9BF74|nr:hypothetical protein [Arthrobacter sp. Soil736]